MAGTLRTRENTTALELATRLRRKSLFDLLQPVQQTTISPQRLQKLEDHFHNLIRFEAGSFVEAGKLYLPTLEYLTELDGDDVWFPIQLEYASAVSFPMIFD